MDNNTNIADLHNLKPIIRLLTSLAQAYEIADDTNHETLLIPKRSILHSILDNTLDDYTITVDMSNNTMPLLDWMSSIISEAFNIPNVSIQLNHDLKENKNAFRIDIKNNDNLFLSSYISALNLSNIILHCIDEKLNSINKIEQMTDFIKVCEEIKNIKIKDAPIVNPLDPGMNTPLN